MRILLLLLLANQAWADEPCTEQNYSNPKVKPRWECPGPDEAIMVPKMSVRPSRGLPRGSSITTPDRPRWELGYDAIVLDKDRVIRLGLLVKALRKLRWSERHHSSELLGIERKYLSDRGAAKLKLEKARVSYARTQRDQARKERDTARKWYRSWTCGLIVGVVTTAAVITLTAYTLKRWQEPAPPLTGTYQ